MKEVITEILRFIFRQPDKDSSSVILEKWNKTWQAINDWKKTCFPEFNFDLKLDCLFSKRTENYLLKDFFAILGDLLGITWNPKLLLRLDDEEFFKDIRNNLVSIFVINDLHPRIIELNLANHSRGVVSLDCEDRARRNYEASLYYIRLAFSRQPTNEHTLFRYCLACEKLAIELEKKGRKEEAENMQKRSDHWIDEACELPDPQPNVLLAGGLLNLKRAHDVFSELLHRELESSEEMKEHLKTGLYKNLLEKGLEISEEMKKFLEKAKDLFKKAWDKNKGHPHIGFMLADVMILLGSDVKDVIEYVTGKGNNGLYHRLCFLLQAQQWENAAEVARGLRQKLNIQVRKMNMI